MSTIIGTLEKNIYGVLLIQSMEGSERIREKVMGLKDTSDFNSLEYFGEDLGHVETNMELMGFLNSNGLTDLGIEFLREYERKEGRR